MSCAPPRFSPAVVRGKMIGGFALVAYPAQYGNSGVMTFMVNHTGGVFQKDLGPCTPRIARRMTSFSPDQTWKKVEIAKVTQAGMADREYTQDGLTARALSGE